MAEESKNKQWAAYNNELMQYAKRGEWGLYRNTRLYMGEQLKKEKRYKAALQTFMEICYLDLNGPSNHGIFNPSEGMLYPGILNKANIEIRRLKLQEIDIHELFIETVDFVWKAMKMPIGPDGAWKSLTRALYSEQDV